VSRVRGIDRALLPAYEPGRCRWCATAVEPPRRTFCSDECVEQWKLRSSSGHRRRRVFERDRGVCAACSRDCPALAARLGQLLYTNPSRLDAELAGLRLTRRSCGPLDRRVPIDMRGRIGDPVVPGLVVWDPERTLWEADHVLAVVEGGGSCDLSNLQTLCVWCHRAKTAELRRRLAAGPDPPADLFDADDPPADLFDERD
jgi:5-methylcytosine-specific restriction enzyme A